MKDGNRRWMSGQGKMKLVTLACASLAALIISSKQVPVSGTGDPIPSGTPQYLPLAMKSIPTPTPVGGGRIAFESNRAGPGIFEIYSMNSDGSDVRRLTRLGWYSRDPSWSPDYTRIVFDSGSYGDEESDREIYIINADGTGLVQRTSNGVKDYDPSWSPDGSRIAYASYGSNWEIFSMNTSGGGWVNLTNRPYRDLDPCWSPDGTKIAFSSEYVGSDFHIWRMNADGSGKTQLTFGTSVDDTDPSWSTDGTRIAFESNRDGDIEIWVMNADGSGARNLTNNPSADVDPSWMNGAERIVFGSYRSGNGEVYIMNSDGSGVPQQLTYNGMTDGDACARPGCP